MNGHNNEINGQEIINNLFTFLDANPSDENKEIKNYLLTNQGMDLTYIIFNIINNNLDHGVNTRAATSEFKKYNKNNLNRDDYPMDPFFIFKLIIATI